MERHPLFMIRRLNIVQMSILPKEMYRFNEKPLKSPNFSCGDEKVYSKICRKYQGTPKYPKQS